MITRSNNWASCLWQKLIKVLVGRIGGNPSPFQHAPQYALAISAFGFSRALRSSQPSDDTVVDGLPTSPLYFCPYRAGCSFRELVAIGSPIFNPGGLWYNIDDYCGRVAEPIQIWLRYLQTCFYMVALYTLVLQSTDPPRGFWGTRPVHPFTTLRETPLNISVEYPLLCPFGLFCYWF